MNLWFHQGLLIIGNKIVVNKLFVNISVLLNKPFVGIFFVSVWRFYTQKQLIAFHIIKNEWKCLNQDLVTQIQLHWGDLLGLSTILKGDFCSAFRQKPKQPELLNSWDCIKNMIGNINMELFVIIFLLIQYVGKGYFIKKKDNFCVLWSCVQMIIVFFLFLRFFYGNEESNGLLYSLFLPLYPSWSQFWPTKSIWWEV